MHETVRAVRSKLYEKPRVVGAAAAFGVFAFFGTVTGLIPNPLYVRMVPRTYTDFLFLSLTSVLVGVYMTQRVTCEECATDGWAFAGTAGGFFAVACPICNVLLLTAFSSSALMTYFDPYRPVLGAVSVVVLVTAVYLQRRKRGGS
jgi:hypothetical protein